MFVGIKTLTIGVFGAVLTFNDGTMARTKVLNKMGIAVGSNCKKTASSTIHTYSMKIMLLWPWRRRPEQKKDCKGERDR